ncbi:hypothetical protein A2U01_0085283, partial [Trifolium medium]|nr:hypothetical protein [Trifolium medium]
DGRETSLSSDEDGEGVQVLTECQAEKRPQSTQEIPVDRAQPPPLITREDIANLITALRSTNETTTTGSQNYCSGGKPTLEEKQIT